MSLPQIKLNKTLVIIVVAVLLLAELTWAGWALLIKNKNQTASSKSQVVDTNPAATLALTTDKKEVKVGERVPVSIIVYSSRPTDGADVVVIFDPNFLTLEPNQSGLPVSVSTLYSDYPANGLDTKTGKIILSGITSKPEGVVPKGNLGTINFIAKATGITKIQLEFTAGLTSDSNVTETKTGQDLLGSVTNLDLVVTK